MTFHPMCLGKATLSRIAVVAAAVAIATVARSAEPFAGSCVSAAYMRAEPTHRAELVSQALMGHPLRVLDSRPEWLLVESPEGYKGWVSESSVVQADSAAMHRWLRSPRLIVTASDVVKAVTDTLTLAPATDLVNGCILRGSLNPGARYTTALLPDGRKVFVDQSWVEDFDTFASAPFDVDKALALARSMMGVTYLWGGLTVKEADCSGLVRAAYLAAGVILPRDASQQAQVGHNADPDAWSTLKPGDLVFFGDGTPGRITHVAIYEGDGNILHSSGRVRRNSLNPHSPHYIGRPVVKCTRIVDYIGTPGITPLISHPLYFITTEP